MVTVNEYRRNFVGRIRETRRAMDKRRKEIEVENGWDDAIIRWKIRLEEAKTRLSNLLQQRRNGIMWDVNLSSDAKEAIINVYEQEYSLKIEEEESVFKKVYEERDRQVEADERFKEMKKRLEEILSERNSEEYKKAEQAHILQRNKYYELKKLDQQLNLATEDLAVAKANFREKEGNRKFNEQWFERISDREFLLRKTIWDLKRKLEEANLQLPNLGKNKERVLELLENAKQEESLAKENLDEKDRIHQDILYAQSKAVADLIEQRRRNKEVDIESLWNTWSMINKSIKWSNEIQYFTWSTWNELNFDRKILLEEIEKISSTKWPKIWKYIWIYEKLWYTILDKSSLISQLNAARKLYPSILWKIKNDLIKRIQDLENNKPQEKKWRGWVFFLIDFSCYWVNWGII